MKRYLIEKTKEFLEEKMVWIAGPRQCGKTTLAKSLLPPHEEARYYNWDAPEDQEKILKHEYPRTPGLLILDEIHKYARWRNELKGLFDKRSDELKILVTGSAKLDSYRRGGDSLQGRYYLLRMHPLSLAELGDGSRKTLEGLLRYGGFPEPYFGQDEAKSRIWSRSYRTRLIREDLLSLNDVREVSLLEHLSIRLPDCVGSPLSLNALREDIGVSHRAVTRWIGLLENLYAIFRVYPFGSPKVKALKKESKHYQFDWTLVSDPGARFENLIACHLLKWCHWVEDTQGHEMELRYYRDAQKREVDFVVLKDRTPVHFIEAKLSEKNVSPHLKYLKGKFPKVRATQVVLEGDYDLKTESGIELMSAHRLLMEWV